MARLTHHAADRGRERQGYNEAAMQRMLPIVMRDGAHHKEFSGQFRRYLDKILWAAARMKAANKVIVHGDYLYLFGYEDALITVYYTPNEFKPAYRKWKKRKDADKLTDAADQA